MQYVSSVEIHPSAKSYHVQGSRSRAAENLRLKVGDELSKCPEL